MNRVRLLWLLSLLLFTGGCTINLVQPAPGGTLPVGGQQTPYQPGFEQPQPQPYPQPQPQPYPQPQPQPYPQPQPQPVAGTPDLQALTPGWLNPLAPQRVKRRQGNACRPAGEAAIGAAPLRVDLSALARAEEQAIAKAGYRSTGAAKAVERPAGWSAPLGLFGLVSEVNSDLCFEGNGQQVTKGSGTLDATVAWRIYARPGPRPLVERRLTGRARLARSEPEAFDRLLRSAVLDSLRAFLSDPEVRQVIESGRRPDGFSIPPGGLFGDPAPVVSAPTPVPPVPPGTPQPQHPWVPNKPNKPQPGTPQPDLALPVLPPFGGGAAERSGDIARAIVAVEGAGGSGLGVILDQKEGLVLTAATLVREGSATVKPALGSALSGTLLRRDEARGVALLSLGRNGPWRALPLAPQAPQSGGSLLRFLEERRGKQPARFASVALRRASPNGALALAAEVPPPPGTPLLDPAGNLAAVALGGTRGMEIGAALAGLGLR